MKVRKGSGRRYASTKVSRSGCASLEQPPEEIPHAQGKRNPGKMVGVARGIRGQTH